MPNALKVPASNKYNTHETARPVQRSAPKFGFGTSKRPQSSSGLRAPGPGAYEIKGIVGHETQGKSLGLKLRHQSTS